MHAGQNKFWYLKGLPGCPLLEFFLWKLNIPTLWCVAMNIRLYRILLSLCSSSKSDQSEPPRDTSSSSDSDSECLDHSCNKCCNLIGLYLYVIITYMILVVTYNFIACSTTVSKVE